VRLSDGDREQLLAQLKAHAAAGRLSLEELERRVGLVLSAADTEALAPALSDLPPLRAAAERPRRARGRGHAESDAPAPGWRATAERFRDPRSGRIMRVWVDAAGGRHYVPDAG